MLNYPFRKNFLKIFQENRKINNLWGNNSFIFKKKSYFINNIMKESLMEKKIKKRFFSTSEKDPLNPYGFYHLPDGSFDRNQCSVLKIYIYYILIFLKNRFMNCMTLIL